MCAPIHEVSLSSACCSSGDLRSATSEESLHPSSATLTWAFSGKRLWNRSYAAASRRARNRPPAAARRSRPFSDSTMARSAQVSTGTKTSLSFQDGPVFTRVHRREGPAAPIQQAPTRNLLAYKFARFWALPWFDLPPFSELTSDSGWSRLICGNHSVSVL